MMRNSLATLCCVLFVAGCASSSFERHAAAGRWQEAVQAFDADSALHLNPRALYRAALIYGSPDLDTYQPAVARELLTRLLQFHPGSPQSESAVRFIALLDELERMRRDSSAREQQLRWEFDRLHEESARIRADLEALELRLASQAEEGRGLRALIERLEISLRDRESQLRTLRDELERLKAIDLRTAPRRATPTDPTGR